MVYNVTTIDYVINDHKFVKENTEHVGASMNDIQALSNLQWTLGSAGALIKRREDLQQTLTVLEEGLLIHFGYEEKMLPPLFGRVLMLALRFEHQEIKQAIDEVKSVAFGDWPKGMSQEELLSRGTGIQEVISRLCQLIKGHLKRENIILKMMKRALEEGNQYH